MSEPWRFYSCGPETKAKLCGLNEDKRAAAEGVPEWLIVTLASEHAEGEKLFYEDMQAVACARVRCERQFWCFAVLPAESKRS